MTQSYRAFEMAASCTKMELVKKGAMVVRIASFFFITIKVSKDNSNFAQKNV